MKREEEIQKLIDEETGIDNYGSSDYQIGVCDGVRFADKTMLDRACEWLGNRHNIEKCLGVLTSRTEDLSKAFRQAMEGGAE